VDQPRQGAARHPQNVSFVLRLSLERFRAKWIPVRVKKTRQNKTI
jgi:hypothetical protein